MKEDMNGKYEKIEHLLKQARPVAPTPQLKDRVTSAAGKRWSRSPSEIPWQVPLRRLAISAAAGVLVVLMADSFSTCIVPRPGHGTSTPATTDSSVPGDVYQTDYGIFVSALSTGGCDWPVVERLTPSERLRTSMALSLRPILE